MRIWSGFDIAERINRETRDLLATLPCAPTCAILLDDRDAGMAAYAARQRAQAATLGITLQTEPYGDSPTAVMTRLHTLANDPKIDAIATLYPLPHALDPLAVALAIGPAKDIDGLHPMNAGHLALGADTRPPATAAACVEAARALTDNLTGAEVTLIGASRIIGRPLAQLLLDAGATVTLCHKDTKDLTAHTRSADIIVSAAGVAGLLTPEHLRDGQVILDVSINRGPNGLLGDTDLTACADLDLTVTHVPNGIGPITTATLLKNIALAARNARK